MSKSLTRSGRAEEIPTELVVQAQPLGSRLEWVKISGQGKNALDFHIAFYLGQELMASPKSDCIVLSGDTGFDPLIQHLQGRGHVCRRVDSLDGVFAGAQKKVERDPSAPAVPRMLRLMCR